MELELMKQWIKENLKVKASIKDFYNETASYHHQVVDVELVLDGEQISRSGFHIITEE
jgi:hypothetical protein